MGVTTKQLKHCCALCPRESLRGFVRHLNMNYIVFGFKRLC
nr:MAG TPA: hypothetical protein [Caudoviricetes sp.]